MSDQPDDMNPHKAYTNATLSPREAIVDNADVKDAGCYGCQKTRRWAMITGVVSADPRANGGPTFYDLFLTREQAERVHALLGALLTRLVCDQCGHIEAPPHAPGDACPRCGATPTPEDPLAGAGGVLRLL